jgi:hypothetical protein
VTTPETIPETTSDPVQSNLPQGGVNQVSAVTPVPAAPAAVAAAVAPPARGDSDDATISSAISAHIDSVVNDARRNVGKFANR